MMTRRAFLRLAGVAGVGLSALAITGRAHGQAPAAGRAIALTTDLGVPADGSDVSALIPRALARVPAGSTVVFQQGGRYGIAGALRLENLVNLTLSGSGAALVRTAPSARRARHVEIEGCRNLTIEGLELAGPERDWRYEGGVEFQPGFYLRGNDKVVLRDLYVHHVGGDGIQVHGRVQDPARNITIERVRVEFARRQGITLTNCDGVVVQDCSISWVGRSGFDLEPYGADWYSNRITIRRCKVTHLNNYILAAGGDGRHDGLLFERNDGLGGLGFALIGNRSAPPATGVVVTGNRYTWDDPDYRQRRNLSDFHLRAGDAVTVTDNVLTFNSETAVEILAPAGVVRGNTFAGVNEGLLVGRGVEATGNTVTTRKGQPAPTRVSG
jgi:hypothetical protein